MSDFADHELLYRAVSGETANQNHALLWFQARNWLQETGKQDRTTGEMESMPLLEILWNTAQREQVFPRHPFRDRLYHLIEHARPALLTLTQAPVRHLIREHAEVPLHAVRELDASCFLKISRRPGLNIRQKLAGQRHVPAVQRRWTEDSLENRLMLAFADELFFWLEIRRETWEEDWPIVEKELLDELDTWLADHRGGEIRPWTHQPPNNVLLSHPQYRRVWDSWLWLQDLPAGFEQDEALLPQHLTAWIYWHLLSRLSRSGSVRIPDQPCVRDMDDVTVRPVMCNTDSVSCAVDFCEEAAPHKACQLSLHSVGHPEIHLQTDEGKKTLFRLIEICRESLRVEVCGSPIRFVLNPETFPQLQSRLLKQIIGTVPDPAPKPRRIEAPKEIPLAAVETSGSRVRVAHGKKTRELDTLFLMQIWRGPVDMDIPLSRPAAIHMGKEKRLMGLGQITCPPEKLRGDEFVTAAKGFATTLHEQVPARRLVYLSPDGFDDFSTKLWRGALKMSYPESIPLPRSIAAVWSALADEKLKQALSNSKTYVRVLDWNDEGLSETRVQILFNPVLKEALPESGGFHAVRLQTERIKSNLTSKLKKYMLAGLGSGLAENLANALGPADLVKLDQRLSLLSDFGKWTHIEGVEAALKQEIPHIENVIADAIENVDQKFTNGWVYLTGYAAEFFTEKGFQKRNCRRILNLTLGAYRLSCLQDQLDRLCSEKMMPVQTLWCDSLPPLKTRLLGPKGYRIPVDFVKNEKVNPVPGKAVRLKFKGELTLPANQKEYSFPLFWGEGNEKLSYVARLRHPDFPLKRDTLCRLEMLYTYGAEEPYKLIFQPTGGGSRNLKQLAAVWDDKKAFNISDLKKPGFPKLRGWTDGHGRLHPDLKEMIMEWCELSSYFRMFQKESCLDSPNHYDVYELSLTNEIHNENGYVYYFAATRFGQSVYVSSHKIIRQDDSPPPRVGDVLFAKITKAKRGWAAEMVFEDLAELLTEYFNKFKMRFRAITIKLWSELRSVSDQDAPEDLRRAYKQFYDTAQVLFSISDVPGSILYELELLFSVMHRDLPDFLIEKNRKKTQQNLPSEYNNLRQIGFCFGDLKCDWQKEMFQNLLLINDQDNSLLFILSIAVWRSHDLVCRIPDKLHARLLVQIAEILKKVKSSSLKKFYSSVLSMHALEYLLAALRLSDQVDCFPETVNYLNENLETYSDLIDTVIYVVVENDIEIRSRIHMVKEKDNFSLDVPDLLYALRHHLTGAGVSPVLMVQDAGDES